MDESLSDFQEKKQNCTGPKNLSKVKVSIKKRKQIKGQRDIRTLVRSTKNELVTYTKDFNQMCKTSGIDVDSEQLQLAIALSKSLHDSESQVDVETVTVKPLSALERTKKIKSTLQEYGFKVPTCVLKKTSKRLISNKQYKLLTTPESEKNKIICSKYSEVLRRNHSNLQNHGVENTDKEIYNKATNISYNQIKHVEEFYIRNRLIEKSTHASCLLKDWSAIPGRPISPALKVSNFKFHEFEFTQDELDCILSGTLQLAQEIVNRKTMTTCDKESTQETINEDMNIHIDPKPHTYDCKNKQLSDTFEHPSHINKNMDATQRARSASPDLFEDDEYTLQEPNHSEHSEIKASTSNKDKMSFMDITACVSSVSYKEQTIVQSEVCTVSEISKKPFLESNSYFHDEVVQVSNDNAGLNGACDKKDRFRQNAEINSILHTDIQSQTELFSETIIEVNDLMEVTECVVSDFNQQNVHNIEQKYNRNLQEKNMSKLNTINIKKLSLNNKDVQSDYSHDIIENIDLTQTMVENVDCLKGDYIERSGYIKEKEPVPLDLTQSSNSNEDLPMVQLSDTKSSSEDTIIIYDYDISNNISLKDVVLDTETSKECVIKDTSNEKISLNKDSVSINKMPSYEDNIDVLSDNDNAISNSPIDNDDTIDLTQSPELSTQTYHSSESLGKQNNVSIDYDELYDMNASTSENISKKNYTIVYESLDNNGKQKNLSCESAKSLQVCSPEISKKENFYHLSLDHLSNEENINTVFSDSNLPNVEVKSICKNTKVISKNCESQCTPQKLSGLSNKSVVHTPVNDEYIIKTDNVTPILDYASMTTPARNKELEKYGLKPFKRKRAIQMLTYLYNQTHPVVEQCVLDEIPSTSKKPKVVEQGTTRKSTAHKHQVATFEEQDLNKENLYVETKQHPDIKEIHCSPEDWVFQTREKAKVQSCRVPLHIVFHNYVSCRSMLRAAILRYEPINIDVIHKDLIANGFRYNPKDMLKFMDKKCITVKTAENKTRNQNI